LDTFCRLYINQLQMLLSTEQQIKKVLPNMIEEATDVGISHHITQRRNARRFIPQDEADRKVYLDLLRQSREQHGVALIGYCLMSNHVHLVAVPRNADAS
jgi:REP element-mobilizing transposase RayT